VHNRSAAPAKVRIFDHYTRQTVVRFLAPDERFEQRSALDRSFGW
jgi:hypothetical protein